MYMYINLHVYLNHINAKLQDMFHDDCTIFRFIWTGIAKSD